MSTAELFADFFAEVHGYPPFAWQTDLVDQILVRGWPRLVDVPTGLGKTAMLDIAVFLTSVTGGDDPQTRIGRRRIFFVVDRRIVVDQAYEHALRISVALGTPSGSATALVAERLRTLTPFYDGDSPLAVVRMRGGTTWDAAWLSRPDLPGLVTGTVDQVGSRLLFRGYGVSTRRRPIDAALVGTDSLILVDEAHLATAMLETLHRARVLDTADPAVRAAPSHIVQLSATQQPQAEVAEHLGWAYRLDASTHTPDREPVAARRLHAAKRLHPVLSTKATVVGDLTSAAMARAHADDARVLVVCNTVDRARLVHAALAKAATKAFGADCWLGLLIGRSREIDREAVVDAALGYFGAGSDRGDADERCTRAILVATQTVEVGADLDATDLITESAAWDALVQRIGRVNRRGHAARATVTVVHDDVDDGPVYGVARDTAWTFLTSLAGKAGDQGVDVSPSACRVLTEDAPATAYLKREPAPLLLPGHLDAWARTQPAPTNDVPVQSFLHGLGAPVAAVTIAWREGLVDGSGDRLGPAEAGALIDLVPVAPAESVEVTLGAARRWLAGDRAQPLSDFDDADDDWANFGDDSHIHALRAGERPDGGVVWRWVQAADLQPGDALVVPAESGGLDEWGWAPLSTLPVCDVAEVAALVRGRPLVRLDPGIQGRLGLPPPGDRLMDLLSQSRRVVMDAEESLSAKDREDLVGEVAAWLRSPHIVERPGWTSSRRDALVVALAGPDTVLVAGADEPCSLLRQDTRSDRWGRADDGPTDGTVHLSASSMDGRITLAAHLDAVAERAQEIAAALGLNEVLEATIVDAARWHDLGKIDPRFQAMLFGGDAISAALAGEPVAKSGMASSDWVGRNRARALSHLPPGARHEAWSATLVSAFLDDPSTSYGGDSDLLVHLVASHHGHARPLLPPVVDRGSHRLEVEVDGRSISVGVPHAVDLTAADRFERLNQKYGRWGLALLESIVRCADMTVSGEGR